MGDEYNYRSGENPITVLNQSWKEVSKQVSGNLYKISFACEVIVPAKAGSKEVVTLPVELHITGF